MSIAKQVAAGEATSVMIERCARIEAAEGINPLAIYCSATGRQIGILNHATIAIMPNTSDLSDSTLIMQCLVAARPSHGWLIKRKDSYMHFYDVDPTGLLIYLLGLIYDSRENSSKLSTGPDGSHQARWLSSDNLSSFVLGKIRLHKTLANMTDDAQADLLHDLLELDARKGLQHATPPSALTWPMLTNSPRDTTEALLQSLATQWKQLIKRERDANSRGGNYFSRQATGITPDPKHPKRSYEDIERDKQVSEAFLAVRDISTLEEAKNEHGRMSAIPVGTTMSANEAIKKAAEFKAATRQQTLIKASALKI